MNSQSHLFLSLTDSGFEQNLLHAELVKELNLPVQTHNHPMHVIALGFSPIAFLTHLTSPISLTVSGNNQEIIQFVVFPI